MAEIQSIKTEGGELIFLPEIGKLYLLEKLPLNPTGAELTDLTAQADLKAQAEQKLGTVV
jgi:hypothetical protein